MGVFDPSICSRGEAIISYRSNPPSLPVGWYQRQYIDDRCNTDSGQLKEAFMDHAKAIARCSFHLQNDHTDTY